MTPQPLPTTKTKTVSNNNNNNNSEEEDAATKQHQHEEDEEDVVVRAIREGVCDVIRIPLARQNSANLWQHCVRNMLRDSGNVKMSEVLRRSRNYALQKENFRSKNDEGRTEQKQRFG